MSAAPQSARLRQMRMTPRSWITAGWVSMTAAAGLAIAAIVQALDAVNPTCVQPLVTHGLVPFTCHGAGAELVRGLICAVLAGVAFFSGLLLLGSASALHAADDAHPPVPGGSPAQAIQLRPVCRRRAAGWRLQGR